MPALMLNILKILFIVLLFLFLWQVAGAIRLHIGGGQSSRRGRGPSELVVLSRNRSRSSLREASFSM